ncbi:MAG: hypothetical protein HY921_05265 [Elusimicrobia bacterium]|nr:hypothetical protein [Elusimicrobiota bacterium]
MKTIFRIALVSLALAAALAPGRAWAGRSWHSTLRDVSRLNAQLGGAPIPALQALERNSSLSRGIGKIVGRNIPLGLEEYSARLAAAEGRHKHNNLKLLISLAEQACQGASPRIRRMISARINRISRATARGELSPEDVLSKVNALGLDPLAGTDEFRDVVAPGLALAEQARKDQAMVVKGKLYDAWTAFAGRSSVNSVQAKEPAGGPRNEDLWLAVRGHGSPALQDLTGRELQGEDNEGQAAVMRRLVASSWDFSRTGPQPERAALTLGVVDSVVKSRQLSPVAERALFSDFLERLLRPAQVFPRELTMPAPGIMGAIAKHSKDPGEKSSYSRKLGEVLDQYGMAGEGEKSFDTDVPAPKTAKAATPARQRRLAIPRPWMRPIKIVVFGSAVSALGFFMVLTYIAFLMLVLWGIFFLRPFSLAQIVAIGSGCLCGLVSSRIAGIADAAILFLRNSLLR